MHETHLMFDEALQPSNTFIGPHTFHDRNGLINRPGTLLQKRLNNIETHSRIHHMKIKVKKTKIMPFNFSKKYNFIPSYFIEGRKLNVVYEEKLLGVKIQSDCKWASNTKYMTNKAKSRFWYIRRLKKLGASVTTLLDLFKLRVRSAVEMAVPLWAGAITQKEIKSI